MNHTLSQHITNGIYFPIFIGLVKDKEAASPVEMIQALADTLKPLSLPYPILRLVETIDDDTEDDSKYSVDIDGLVNVITNVPADRSLPSQQKLLTLLDRLCDADGSWRWAASFYLRKGESLSSSLFRLV